MRPLAAKSWSKWDMTRSKMRRRNTCSGYNPYIAKYEDYHRNLGGGHVGLGHVCGHFFYAEIEFPYLPALHVNLGDVSLFWRRSDRDFLQQLGIRYRTRDV